MWECQAVPYWSFVDSPRPECASKRHSDHNRVKQYAEEGNDITDLKKQITILHILKDNMTCLTAIGSLSIVYMNLYWTHITIVWTWALVRLQLSKIAIACDERSLYMSITECLTWAHQFWYNGAATENAKKSQHWQSHAIGNSICSSQQKACRLRVVISLSGRRDILPWMPMRDRIPRTSSKWSIALHVLLC